MNVHDTSPNRRSFQKLKTESDLTRNYQEIPGTGAHINITKGNQQNHNCTQVYGTTKDFL